MQRHLVLSIVRVALDLKLFDILGGSSSPLHVDELSSKIGAEEKLLGIIKETGTNEFTSSTTSNNLLSPESQAGIYHNFDVLGPAYQALPDFLAAANYQSPTETHKAAFQKAWNTDLPLWTWFQSRPKETAQFNRFMLAQRSSTPNCFNFFPIEEECGNWPAEKPVFVDIGGASGQQCIEFRRRFPNIKGRVIFQDLPGEIEHAISQGLPEGVEAIVHDFYTPQIIKGAKIYYLRAILHDHADDKARLILKNIMQAMDSESLILLDEMVLPNEGVDWFATQTDLTMLAAFGSMERTEKQWGELLEGVGLRVRRVVTYTWAFRLSVIVAGL
ncbi:O-methyl transferase B protein [Rutstroemia sp. NJR-2017a BVV2]|nr:O-methyl transferase B protein [Rutstroemia sp. NJR-2017a BVV2]